MRLLLDTHTLLWWLTQSYKLTGRAREAIADVNNNVQVSVVSAFEITQKNRIGKLPNVERLIAAFQQQMTREGFAVLPISLDHALLAGSLAIPHKDPFDRLLIAQAQVEQLLLVTNEERFDAFGVRRLW